MIHSKVLASTLLAIGILAIAAPASAQYRDAGASAQQAEGLRDRRRDGGQDRDRESRGGYEQRGDAAQAGDTSNGSVSDRPRYQPQEQQRSGGRDGGWRGDGQQSGGQQYGGQRDGGQRYDGNRDGNRDGGYAGRTYDRNDGQRNGNRYDGNRYDGNRYDGNRHDGNRYGGNRYDGRRDGRWDGRNGGHDGRRYDHRDYRRGNRGYYATRRYHGSRYVRPHGYSSNRWNIGLRLPSLYFGPSYYVNYGSYGLLPPPYGYHWVRVDRDVYLVDIRTGFILDVMYDLFY